MIEAFSLVAVLNANGVIADVLDGSLLSLGTVEDADRLVEVAGWGLLVGYLLIGPITFLPWFARAYANLPRLGMLPLRHGVGWSVGGWFVPLANFVIPKRIANDIYRASSPDARPRGGWPALRVSPLLHWWWGLFLLQGIVGRIGSNLGENEATGTLTRSAAIEFLEEQRTAYLLVAISCVLAIVAAALAVRVVVEITRMQTAAIRAARELDSTTTSA